MRARPAVVAFSIDLHPCPCIHAQLLANDRDQAVCGRAWPVGLPIPGGQ